MNCQCGNFELRITTNLINDEVVVCRNCGRFAPPKAMFTNCSLSSSESKPVYTQAMADKGESPSVGMEIIVRYMHDSKTVTHRGCVLFISDCRVIIDNDTGDHHHLLGDYRCEPLTPPIELIDGKAYQFQHQSCRGLGFYNKRLNEFSSLNHKILIDNCTNIQLLEVKS